MHNKNKCFITIRLEGQVMLSRLRAAISAAAVLLVLPTTALTRGDWPDGPNKVWFDGLQRPDNDKNPQRDPRSRSCCGVADTVKTKFKVEMGDAVYPEDRWYAWFNEQWIAIPPEKIVQDYSPDGQPYLFMLAGTVQCFVRPKGGI
jgi:hypothetical protein